MEDNHKSAEPPPEPNISENQWRSMTNSEIAKHFGFSSGWASARRPNHIPEPTDDDGEKDEVAFVPDQVVEKEALPKITVKKKPPGDDGMPSQ